MTLVAVTQLHESPPMHRCTQATILVIAYVFLVSLTKIYVTIVCNFLTLAFPAPMPGDSEQHAGFHLSPRRPQCEASAAAGWSVSVRSPLDDCRANDERHGPTVALLRGCPSFGSAGRLPETANQSTGQFRSGHGRYGAA